MIYKAQSQFTQSLLLLPETGMGYQIIDAKRQGGFSTERFVVYNSELIVELDNDFNTIKRQILLESYTKMFSQSDFISLESPILVKQSAVRNVRTFSESSMNTKGRHSGTTGAIDNPPRYASGSEMFVRLSAYSYDKRIDFVKMRLRSGSYTTTEADYLTCKRYLDDPVDRYALPNDETIKWAFYIRPKSNDQYRPGVVLLANDHNGGGIEALFDNGTSDRTYLERKPY
ncbi:MAG: hypothetical protein EOL95_03305 [Bacteroidia bacterium]|nr:hypothetical protein [Bacteroidia bacterium]